jgi:hypothetical protein
MLSFVSALRAGPPLTCWPVTTLYALYLPLSGYALIEVPVRCSEYWGHPSNSPVVIFALGV